MPHVPAAGLRTVRWAATTIATLALWGCGRGATAPTTPTDRATLVVVAPIPSLELGQTTTVAAFLVNAAGVRSPATQVTWTVAPATVATITSFGLLTTLAEGTAVVTATMGGIQGSVQLPVVPVPVARVDVSPPTADIGRGEVLQLVAVPRDRSGSALNGRAVQWRSSDTTRATVSATGSVRTLQPGNVTITATSDGVQGQVTVTVRDRANGVHQVTIEGTSALMIVGDTLRLEATVRDGEGRILEDRTVTWAVSIAAGSPVASVSASGLVRALGQGTAVIEATCEGRTASLPIRVVDQLDTSIVVTLASPIVSDTVADTLLVMADVKHVHPLARVMASVGTLNVELKLTPVGRGTLLWAGKLILADLRVGPYVVQVDATDSRGALGRATRAFTRKYKPGDGGTPPGPRSK
jgi:uncharacterized protein YjdB